MKNIKKLIVFILTLSTLLSSLTISVCADDTKNEYNALNVCYGISSDEPPKKDTEK